MVLCGGLALAGVALLAVNGCHDGKDSPVTSPGSATSAGDSAPAPTPRAVIYLEDDGKAFDVAVGGTVTFKLASRAGTGYAWAPTQIDSAALVQQGDRTSELASETPGAPKLDVFQFTANAPGATTVAMSLRRPFGDAAAARVIRVTIRAH